MPPKSRKVNKRPLTTIQSFPAAFAELCAHIKKGPATANGLIKAYEGIHWLREFLRGHRTKSTTIEVKFIEELAPILETTVCRQVDSLIFATIIEVILQTDYCTRCERALYLLSISLHESTKQETKKRKIEIGLYCLNLLLARLVDDSNVPSLRRWIGVLCIQLMRDTPENCDRIRLSREDTRRKIGQLVTGKANEIIRYLCGGLIRELQNENVLLDELWPIGSSKELYQNFPQETQLKTGWSQKFDAYLDVVVNPLESDPVRLYSAYECRLEPDNTFDTREHTMHIFCYPNQITIKLSCLGNAVDQMLDIPTCCISNMMITSDGSLNREQAWVIFDIKHDETNSCFLNGDLVVLERVSICGTHEMAKGMRDDFADVFDIDDQEMLSTQSISQRSRWKLANSQNNSQLDSSTGMYGTTPRLECFSSEIVLTGEGNENAPEEIVYPFEESVSADGEIDNVPEIEVTDPAGMDEGKQITAETQNGEASFILDKSPHPNKRLSIERLSDDTRAVIGNIEPSQSSDNLQEFGFQDDLYDASPQKKQSASVAVVLIKTALTKASPYSPRVSKSQKLQPKKHTVKSKAKAPIKTSTSTSEKRLIVKENSALTEARAVQNSLVSLEIDSLTSPDEHNMSTPKPRDVLAAMQGGTQASLTQRMAQKGKVQNEIQSTTKKPGSNAQILGLLNSEGKAGAGDIYEVPTDDEIDVPVKPKKSAVKSKAKKPIVYSSKATTNKPSRGKTNSQQKQVLLGHVSEMKTSKANLLGKEGLRKSQVDKAKDDNIGREDPTPAQASEVTKSVKVARKNPTKGSHAIKLLSTTTQDQTQPKEYFSKPSGQSNQGFNDDIAPEEIPLRQEPPPNSSVINPQDDVEAIKVTSTKAIETNSSRKAKNVINGVPEKSRKGFATGLSELLSDFDNIDGNHGAADFSNIRDNALETVDSLVLMKDPSPKAAIDYTSQAIQALQGDVAIVEKVVSASSLEFVLSSRCSNSSKKRKEELDADPEIHAQKRKRTETPRLSLPRRSPRLQSKDRDAGVRLDLKRNIQDKIQIELAHQPDVRPIQESAIVTTSTRRIPRFQADEIRDNERLGLTLPDSVHRKVNMIHFSKQGPMNQGRLHRTPLGEPVTTVQPQQPRQKRKLQASEEADMKSPSHKKQYSSPIEPQEDAVLPDRQLGVEVQNNYLHPSTEPKEHSPIGQTIDVEGALDHCIIINDSSPAPIEALRVEELGENKPKRQLSSQGSRVAPNGSPIPVFSIQRINYIKRTKEKVEGQATIGTVMQSVEDRADSGTNVFGPRVRLGSQHKATPGSPRKAEPRYVAHHKTKSGNYEGMATKVVIAPQVDLPDPFVDHIRKPSGFSNRLRTSSGIQSEMSGTAKGSEGANLKKARGVGGGSGPSSVFVDDAERTLVGEQSYGSRSEISLPSMSSGSSSSNSQVRSPLTDVAKGMWNVALRPHYKNLKDAVHRVADEMLIRLSEEEETMGLVVHQYENNSSRLLNNMMTLRTNDKSSMVRGLLQRRSAMANAYSEAVSSVTQSTAIIRESPVTTFEKDWKTTQDQIKEKIKEGGGIQE